MATALIESVLHWKRKLEKNPDDEYILNVIRKLSKVPITLEILEVTHIGKTIRMLSKRENLIGEKARTVLNKWRDIFATQGSGMNAKLPNGNKKENVNKERKKDDPESKYKSSQKSLNTNTSSESSHLMSLKYVDYDPHTQSSEGYNPECPELFPRDKPAKTKKLLSLDTYEPSSVKHKLRDEKEQNENQKKLKLSNRSKSDKKGNIETKHSSTKDPSLKDESHKSASDLKEKNLKEFSKMDPMKSKQPKIHASEAFTHSDVSFEDCLGFNDIVILKKSSKSHSSAKKQSSNIIPSKKKPTEKRKNDPQSSLLSHAKVKISKTVSSKASKSKSSKESKSQSSHSKNEMAFTVPKPVTKLDVADIITSTLPEIQPNYRPLPRSPEFYSPKKKVLSNEEVIKFTTSRREKTAVYSGRKSGIYYTEVPTLLQICTRVLIENIDAIECVGDASYDIMKPVLEKCTPSQLYTIENYNPGFIDDTSKLWEVHCKRDYKLLTPMEHETWRELYWRAHDEREKKLKNVTAHISASMSKSVPVRQVKLAYVDTRGYVKPPRDVARKQAKHGTAVSVNRVTKPNSTPRPSTTGSMTTSNTSIPTTALKIKPKIAPLMAKTLKSMKAFRRK